MRVKGHRNVHLIVERDGSVSLEQADRDARDIVHLLITSLGARTIYFLWERMKEANERYALEGPMLRQRQELDALNSREEGSRES